MAEQDCAILVFSKAPVRGAVKTRLIPVLGEEQAAELYISLLRQTLQTCRDAGFSAIQLWCYPDTGHPCFKTSSEQFEAELWMQYGHNLGDRMCYALSMALKQYPYCILIGCDCPDLRARDLVTASDKLRQGYDVVLGPTADGGYYLLGCNEARRELFQKVDWGTTSVLPLTRKRIRELKLSCYELEEHWDLDRPEDLERWNRGARIEG